MGVYDRDYVREERPAPALAPVLRSPRTWGMLLWLVAWQAVQWKHVAANGTQWYESWWLSSGGLGHGRLWTLLTAAFCHWNAIHLAIVGVALALLGRACEDEGRNWWFLFAPVAAVIGHAGVVLIGGNAVSGTAGAEGAVLGWAMAMFLHPRRTLHQRNGALAPLALGLAALVLFRVLQGVGWPAFGVLAAVPFGAGAALLVRDAKARPVSPAGGVTPAELDALLARVSEVGMDGLTDEERAALQSASKSMRSGR